MVLHELSRSPQGIGGALDTFKDGALDHAPRDSGGALVHANMTFVVRFGQRDSGGALVHAHMTFVVRFDQRDSGGALDHAHMTFVVRA